MGVIYEQAPRRHTYPILGMDHHDTAGGRGWAQQMTRIWEITRHLRAAPLVNWWATIHLALNLILI